jgi:hypothetical protein
MGLSGIGPSPGYQIPGAIGYRYFFSVEAGSVDLSVDAARVNPTRIKHIKVTKIGKCFIFNLLSFFTIYVVYEEACRITSPSIARQTRTGNPDQWSHGFSRRPVPVFRSIPFYLQQTVEKNEHFSWNKNLSTLAVSFICQVTFFVIPKTGFKFCYCQLDLSSCRSLERQTGRRDGVGADYVCLKIHG